MAGRATPARQKRRRQPQPRNSPSLRHSRRVGLRGHGAGALLTQRCGSTPPPASIIVRAPVGTATPRAANTRRRRKLKPMETDPPMVNLASRLLAVPLVLAAALAAHGQAEPGQCGYERWPVKILTDKDRGGIDFKPVDTTVAKLAAIHIHEIPYPNDRRIDPEELHVCRVRARLITVFREQDHDLHLVIADLERPQVTMIAEIPAPECAAIMVTWGRSRSAITRR